MEPGTADRGESRWKRQRSQRRAVLAQLHKFSSVQSVSAGQSPGVARPGDPDRTQLLGATVADGALVAIDGSRPMQWVWSLDKEIKRIATCESAVVVGWDGVKFIPVALRCGTRICPVCFAARAGRAVHRWGPIIDLALQEGAPIWHVTLTQRADAAFGGAVLWDERERWAGPQPQPGEVLPAVGGEGALAAYERWRGTWRTIRTSRYGRTLWTHVAALTGVEWTLRVTKRGAPRQQVPRWHCHGHILCIADPMRLPTWTPEAVMREWTRTNGTEQPRWKFGTSKRGNPYIANGGQYAERVVDRQGLVETLKYPFKPGDVTAAGLLDAWAALRGSRTHQICGPLHGQSRASKTTPWAGWLACGEDADEASPVSMVEWNTGEGWRMVTHQLMGFHGIVELRRRLPDGTYHRWWDNPVPLAVIAAGHPAVSVALSEEGSVDDGSGVGSSLF